MPSLKHLGVLLCYNDADILADSILHLLENNHDLIVWDHGSDDGTKEVLDKFNKHFLERKFIPRDFDFYNLYPEMSKNLQENYIHQYDWVSWPDQDEILEGQDRSKNYCSWIQTIHENGYDYIQFNNFNYWFTNADDQSILSPIQRIRHYSLFSDCAPRIRSWRAEKTNTRIFNHNPLDGIKAPQNFNLRHYPMRSHDQMIRRLNKDRANLQRNGNNYHYENMAAQIEKLTLSADLLHFDNGGELDPEVKYNWRDIYGYSAIHR
jgi:glycosyltransferase involved in cell wall biosynthesis